jgi:hypothetical protein
MNRTASMQRPHRPVTWLPVLALAALCSAAATHAAASATGLHAPAAAARDGQHDFDFLFGRWKIHLRRRQPAANAWAEFDGYGIYRKVWDGRANLNEFEAEGPDGHVEGLTLRTYNPGTRQWSLYWASSRDGILAPPQVGEFHDGVGEFYAQDTIEGRSVFVRYVWSRITADSAHFEQAFSADGGRTWDVNWISDMSRESATGTDAASESARRAPPVTSAQDGRHDFDPLLGSWKFTLKRRTEPLTGSANWVQYVGTGTCYKLWDGSAQLDTVLLHGASRPIEGLTLRLFDPKSRQWRLYWANSRDGIVVAPQIGRFSNGHGEFYAPDVLNDSSILVKYDWTRLESATPHFEQSFSADGGRTWEVNWITDQTREAAAR